MPPSASTLTSALQRAVRAGDITQLTLKSVRHAAEQQLGLAPGFFKDNEAWNVRSKTIVRDEVARVEAQGQADVGEDEPKSVRPRKQARAERARVGGEADAGGRAAAGSPAADESGDGESPVKGRRTLKNAKRKVVDGESDVEDGSPPPKARKTQQDTKHKPVDDESDMSDVVDDSPPPKARKTQKAAKEKTVDDESEMSEVLDSTPPPKARKTQATTKDTKRKPKATAAGASGALDPNLEEIRKLQGQLVKCGIRKVWGRELMHCASSKDKIRHLKGMLRDAGMDGRFSEDKARQIKERRELAADLEAVQEGDKKWGMEVESGDEGDAPRPRRRLAKGMEAIAAFDDEESE